MDRPKDIREYKKWLKDHRNVVVDDRMENYYGSVTYKILKDFKGSNIWTTINDKGVNFHYFNEEDI